MSNLTRVSKAVACIVLSLFASHAFSIENDVKSAGYDYQWTFCSNNKDPNNPDQFITQDEYNSSALFGYYDGLGQSNAAKIASQHVNYFFLEGLRREKIMYGHAVEPVARLMQDAFLKTESKINQQAASGTTATLAYFSGDTLTLSWVGNSTAVLFKNSKLAYQTEDHTPARERKRLKDAKIPTFIRRQNGHEVMYIGTPENSVDISRALGLQNIKNTWPQALLSTPELLTFQVSLGDMLVMANHDFWIQVTSDQISAILENKNDKSLDEIGKMLCDAAKNIPEKPVTVLLINVVQGKQNTVVNGKDYPLPTNPIKLDLTNGALYKTDLDTIVEKDNDFNVIQIDLRDNELEQLDDALINFLNRFANLDILLLGSNKLKDLPPTFLQGNPRLQTLGLASNNFKDVPQVVLDNIDQFRVVNLVNNQISEGIQLSWPEKVRKKVGAQGQRIKGSDPVVSEIDLSDGKLKAANLDDIVPLNKRSAILSLDLSNNNLEKIDDSLLSFIVSFLNLRALYLDSNQLEALPDQLIEKLTKITTIGLSNNNFSQVPPVLIKNADRLTRVNMNRNKIGFEQKQKIPYKIRKRELFLVEDQWN